MRRLPIYFLVDVSESMVGEPIQQVENGMRQIVQELRTDPYALETAFISVIAFAGKAKSLSPLTELYKFYPPTFPIGGGTSLGCALDFLMDDIDHNVVKTTEERKGDWKPIISFLPMERRPTILQQPLHDGTTNTAARPTSWLSLSAIMLTLSCWGRFRTMCSG